MLEQTGRALQVAHAAGLVHRDVKPGNILITPTGQVKLTDFGIAKGLSGNADDDLTSPNVMMGTAKYLSPEQVRGRKLDGRADLYSLGLVLYECLAGRVPFLGETDADTALARLNRDPTDLTSLRPTLPDGLATLIHRLLARKPDDRYVSGEAVRLELTRIAALPKVELDRSRDVTRSNGPKHILNGCEGNCGGICQIRLAHECPVRERTEGSKKADAQRTHGVSLPGSRKVLEEKTC